MKPEPSEINVCSICEYEPCRYEDTSLCPAVQGAEELYCQVMMKYFDDICETG